MLTEAETEETLRLLLENVFETSLDLSKKVRLLIKRQFFLLIYLSVLSFLADCNAAPNRKRMVSSHVRMFFDAVEGSYWNNSICTRV